MAGHRIRTPSIFLALFSIHLYSPTPAEPSGDPATLLLQPPSASSDHRPAMVLPLLLSSPNSSHIFTDGLYRRHLQRSDPHVARSSARMRLHDDLLLNGYYTTRLWIGTPPQGFSLIVDTGSTVTYVPCSKCEQCGLHQDPKFQPELSETYHPVKCNADCSCDNEREQCIYERHYAEMSTSSGVLGEDLISFGNQSELKPQRAVFGCENLETGDLFSQHADGIMGLGRGDFSIMDQLVDKGVINDSFSLCYGGMDFGGGAMVLGGIAAPTGMVFTHSDAGRSQYYNIALHGIQVAGKQLTLNPSVFDGKHGTVLDSGTTYAYLPEAAFIAFKNAIMGELHSLKQIHGPDPNYHDICFSGAKSDVSQLSESFPTVEMVFSNGQKLSLSPENYLFRHLKVRGAYCLGIFQNGRDPTTLLGGIVVRNTLVTYDREHEKVGFWKTNCSELWERLHISDATPGPSLSNTENSTNGMPPALAPNETHYNFSGMLQVGMITFNVSLNIKYSVLKPHLSELVGFMARDLDVDTSQIHLMDFISKGNSVVIRCIIYPSRPANYISNVTAMEIIARLAEHRMKLPDTFGSYRLVEWKVEPPSRRTWSLRHGVGVIVGVVVAVVVGLSVSGIWLVWQRRRRHQAATAYKPVDGAVPEQELQPL